MRSACRLRGGRSAVSASRSATAASRMMTDGVSGEMSSMPFMALSSIRHSMFEVWMFDVQPFELKITSNRAMLTLQYDNPVQAHIGSDERLLWMGRPPQGWVSRRGEWVTVVTVCVI